jgi:hypothetical protein
MFKALTAATLLLLSLGAGAGAPADRSVTLTTGVLYAPVLSPGAYLVCHAVNVSGTPLTATIELLNAAGVPIARSVGVVAAPGEVINTSANSHIAGYCRFTFQGAAASVRASICNVQNNSNCVSTLEAR